MYGPLLCEREAVEKSIDYRSGCCPEPCKLTVRAYIHSRVTQEDEVHNLLIPRYVDHPSPDNVHGLSVLRDGVGRVEAPSG